MKQFFILLLVIVSCTSIHAQREADWTFDFEGTTQDVFFHKSTGKIVIQTGKEYIGYSSKTKSIEWKVERNAATKLNAISESEIVDYYEIPLSKLAIINHHVVNVGDGGVLASPEDLGYKKVLNYHYLFEQNKVFLELGSEGMKKGALVDLESNTVLWTNTIGKQSLTDKVASVTTSGPRYPIVSFQPLYINDRLIFKEKNQLISFDTKNGNEVWRQKFKVGNYTIDYKSNTIFFIEKAGGLASSISSAAGAVKNDKTMFPVDISTGEITWKKPLKLDEDIRFIKLYDNELLVVDKKGMNFYDTKTGEERWKKPFEGKRISSVEDGKDEVLVTFKGIYVQRLEPTTGKEKLKKPERVEIDIDESELEGVKVTDVDVDWYNPIELDDSYIYPGSGEVLYLYVKYKNATGRKWRSMRYSGDFEINEEDQQVVSILPNGNLHMLTTNDVNVKRKVVKAKNKYVIDKISVFPGRGYFVYGEHDYAFVSIDGELLHNEKYKIPGEGLRKLGNTLGDLGQVAATSYAVAQVGEASVGATQYVLGETGQAANLIGNFEDDEKFRNMANEGLRRVEQASNRFDMAVAANQVLGSFYVERFSGFREDENNAYFFTKNDEGAKVLLKIEKETGNQVDELLFDNNSPKFVIDEKDGAVYYVNKKTLYVFEKK